MKTTKKSAHKKEPTINKKMSKHLSKMVGKVIRKDLREEAEKIVMLGNKNEIKDLLFQYHSKSHNLFCSVIDSIRNRVEKDTKAKAK